MLEAAASEAAGDKENGEANGDVLCQLGLLPAAAAAGGLSTSRKLPMWSQFERLFAAEAKKRAALRRQRRQARSRPISPDLARSRPTYLAGPPLHLARCRPSLGPLDRGPSRAISPLAGGGGAAARGRRRRRRCHRP